MIKVATSPDPVQQKLRLAKKDWNKKISLFIGDLIDFKKLMNGHPNKFLKEKSFIKDPIPADPATILGSLAGDFQELAHQGNAIIAQQIEYSKNRRKKQIKPVNVEGPPPANDLAKQLASFEDKYLLVAEGSSSISRFFTKLLTPTFGVSEAARIRKYRMSLLDACVKTYKDLGKLQVEITKSSNESIGTSNKLLHKVWSDWMLMYRGFSTYKANMPVLVKDTGGKINTPAEMIEEKKKKEPVPELSENYEAEEKLPVEAPSVPAVPLMDDLVNKANNIRSDYTINYKKLLFKNIASNSAQLEDALTNFLKSSKQHKPELAKMVVESYKQLIDDLNGQLGTSGQSLGEIANELQSQPKTASLEVLSQDFLKKWLGKTNHQLSMFDKTSVYRLDVYKMANEIRATLNQIMNLLEKDMKVDDLEVFILQVNKQLTALRGLMRALHNSASIIQPPANKDNAGFEWGNIF